MKKNRQVKHISIRYSIGKTYSIYFLILILLVTILFGVNSSRLFYSNTISRQQRELSIVSNSINMLVNDAVNTTVTFSVDTRIQEFMRDPEFYLFGLGRVDATKQIGSVIASLWYTCENIMTWTLADPDGNLYSYNAHDFSDLDDLLKSGLNEQLQDSQAAVIWGPYFVNNRWLSHRAQYVLVIAKPVAELMTGKHLGSCFAYVSEKELYEAYSKNVPDDGTLLYLVSEDGMVLSASDKEALSLPFENLITRHSNSIVSIDGTTYIFQQTQLKDYDWTLYSAVPLSIFLHETVQVVTVILLIGLVSILVAFIISFLLARRFTSPITNLVSVMQSIEGGQKHQRAAITGDDEIATLSGVFNHLMDTQEILKENEAVAQQQALEYRLQLLQFQIKPHFLYNSMQTIISLVQLGLRDDAQQMLVQLSSFYRLSLSSGSDIIPLSQELELTGNYLAVQRQRYPEFFDYDISVSCKTDFMIPKLTLQPIVENAIYHGIKPKQGGGHISIAVTEDNECLYVSILDDGIGMDPGILDQIMIPGKNTSFGLYNVQQRLKLLFGETARLTIDSVEGSYTQVTIHIPRGGNI